MAAKLSISLEKLDQAIYKQTQGVKSTESELYNPNHVCLKQRRYLQSIYLQFP